jgi:hypothetical protein
MGYCVFLSIHAASSDAVSLMYLSWQWFEHWRPTRTDHNAGIDVLFRPPTTPEIVRAQAGIGRLQSFDYRHYESPRFGVLRLNIQVVELIDQI